VYQKYRRLALPFRRISTHKDRRWGEVWSTDAVHEVIEPRRILTHLLCLLEIGLEEPWGQSEISGRIPA
jgi:hypothetical protein